MTYTRRVWRIEAMHEEQPLRIEAEIDAVNPAHAPRHHTRAREEQDGDGHLPDDQPSSHVKDRRPVAKMERDGVGRPHSQCAYARSDARDDQGDHASGDRYGD